MATITVDGKVTQLKEVQSPMQILSARQRTLKTEKDVRVLIEDMRVIEAKVSSLGKEVEMIKKSLTKK